MKIVEFFDMLGDVVGNVIHERPMKKEAEQTTREEETLKRLLATPPQPKPKKDASASPKKRGRPAKEKPA
jgi:hypothetical protein